MAYKCRICGANEVEHPGDVCETCAIGADPYASAMQGSSARGAYDPAGQPQQNSGISYSPRSGRGRKILVGGGAAGMAGAVTPPVPSVNQTPEVQQNTDPSVKVYHAGQVPASTNTPAPPAAQGASAAAPAAGSKAAAGPLTNGIVKNISVDTQNKSALMKLFRTLTQGVPYTLENEITMFQVFPDYTGTSLNSMGYACDQVIVYGKLNAGAVSENNDVEVYGKRDPGNNIIADRIINKASGTTITPDKIIPAPVVWGITIAAFLMMSVLVANYGVSGIVWSVIIVLCLTNLPLVFKICMGIFGLLFSFTRRH